MAYTNSSLISCTVLSPNNSGTRTHAIDRITPHCVVGQLKAETIGNVFKKYDPYNGVSSNYGIGTDGKIGLYVPESKRSWCSSNRDNDQRAVTIECASDKTEPFTMNGAVYASLVKLCVDICKRNGKKKLLWLGDKTKTLNYKPAADEMVLTVHRWFAHKSCPGDWLYSRLGNLASEVTKQLTAAAPAKKPEPAKPAKPKKTGTIGKTYTVQVGAYAVKANAEKMQQRLKNAGFDTIIKKQGSLYTVQVGAFGVKANAESEQKKLKAAGFTAIIKTK